MPGGNIDKERAQQDAEARRKDPHGIEGAEVADEDEPSAWPSSDRQKSETTIKRVKPTEKRGQ